MRHIDPAPSPAHGAEVAEMTPRVRLDGSHFNDVVGSDERDPVAPALPSVGKRVGHRHVNDAAACPMALPPRRGMEARHVRRPPFLEMTGYVLFEFRDQPGASDADLPARL